MEYYTAAITLTGVDGSVWDLSGPNGGDQGVILAPGPSKLFDAPAKTFWIETATGSHYQGWQPQRRDPLFKVVILGDDPLHWRELDSQFRLALGMYDDQFTITWDTGDDDPRTLKLRLLEEPKTLNENWEGKDPHLYSTSTLLVAAACEEPFWEAPPLSTSWTLQSGTSGSGLVYYENHGDVEVFQRVTVTAPALKWTLPDPSWGNDHWGRAVSDAAKVVNIPELYVDEDLDIETNPRSVRPWVAKNNAPVDYRSYERKHIYPIPAGTPRTPKTVSVLGAQPGATVTVTIPRRFSRPQGVVR